MTIFVTGTDTNIGKTFVTALLVGCLSSKYNKIAVVKPIESGIPLKKFLKKSQTKLIFIILLLSSSQLLHLQHL